jgi:DUF1009 family protein
MLSIEDLWLLPLKTGRVTLNDIAVTAYQELQTAKVISFVSASPEQEKNDLLQLKFDVVKHIIDVRLAEGLEKIVAAGKKEQREKLESIITAKEDQQLLEKSVEELRAMRDSL